MRLFVALELPADVREALWAWSAALDADAWRRVPADNLHVTLAFLGELPEGDVPAIAEVLRSAAPTAPTAASAATSAARAAPLALTCARVVLLPPRRPRVVSVGLEEAPPAPLAALQAVLARALATAGVYEPDRRPFLAHVTVGRVRRGARPAPLAGLEPPECSFAAPAVTLFESRPGPRGSVYEPLASVALG